MGKIKIQCEATTRTSIKLGKPRRCKAKGYFTPTTRRMLCRFHGCNKTINSKTRKYKGLYNNNNIPLQNKIKLLKNLINFRNKTDEEIKEYITQEQERATNSNRYRTKYYLRHYNQWRSKYRHSKRITDQLDDFLQIFRTKSKLQK